MQELEKIMEEIKGLIEKHKNKAYELVAREPLTQCYSETDIEQIKVHELAVVRDIIRKHMDNNNLHEKCSRRKWYQIGHKDGKNDGWIPVEERLPEDNRYILLSFENFSLQLVGRYEENEEGGAFYIGDCDEEDTCIFNDLYVNAWMPLPKPYRSDPCRGCFGAANNDCQICDKGGKV